jgi:NAD(P)-dependent dehydrogenase (short-subunit alcohol dehydrogenase family)
VAVGIARPGQDLGGQVAIISGGGSGIGRAIALGLAAAGASTVIFDVDMRAAEETARLVQADGGICLTQRVDVAEVARLPEAVETVRQRFGRIDVLVNNAGVGDGLPFESVTPQSFDRVFGIDVRGAFFLAQAAVPTMKAQRHGRIINVSSLIAVRGAAGNPDYAGAKAALIGFTRSWALELAPDGIAVNTIVPALTPTPMATATMTAEALSARAQSVPMKRLGTPGDVAALACFLASSAASFLTGQAISANGGEYVGPM